MSRLDLPKALAAYHVGEGTVRRYGGLPPFPETLHYVRQILQRVGRPPALGLFGLVDRLNGWEYRFQFRIIRCGSIC